MCRFNIFKKKKKEEENQSIGKILCTYLKRNDPFCFRYLQKNHGLLRAYKLLDKNLYSICSNEGIDEGTGKEVDDLLNTAIHSIEQIDKLLFPDKYENIDHSWDNVDWLDIGEICCEAEKYTAPSNVDSMTLEETLNLIEKHNPSFAKAKREELAAQNPDPDPSQPTQ